MGKHTANGNSFGLKHKVHVLCFYQWKMVMSLKYSRKFCMQVLLQGEEQFQNQEAGIKDQRTGSLQYALPHLTLLHSHDLHLGL